VIAEIACKQESKRKTKSEFYETLNTVLFLYFGS